ncbi:MAG TPA: hypothetical protein VFQ06_08030, partial [Nitrospira sp.]|nr:hypothetical protein [Nitrospira sp.]
MSESKRERHNGRRPGKSPPAGGQAVADGKSVARSAGLHYVDDRRPGISRVKHRQGMRYRWPDGRPISDGETLTRIRSLAVPPAWRD